MHMQGRRAPGSEWKSACRPCSSRSMIDSTPKLDSLGLVDGLPHDLGHGPRSEGCADPRADENASIGSCVTQRVPVRHVIFLIPSAPPHNGNPGRSSGTTTQRSRQRPVQPNSMVNIRQATVHDLLQMQTTNLWCLPENYQVRLCRRLSCRCENVILVALHDNERLAHNLRSLSLFLPDEVLFLSPAQLAPTAVGRRRL